VPAEERVHVRVGIEHDADEQLRMLAREARDEGRGGLQVALLVRATAFA
jgi:hypothetical protein